MKRWGYIFGHSKYWWIHDEWTDYLYMNYCKHKFCHLLWASNISCRYTNVMYFNLWANLVWVGTVPPTQVSPQALWVLTAPLAALLMQAMGVCVHVHTYMPAPPTKPSPLSPEAENFPLKLKIALWQYCTTKGQTKKQSVLIMHSGEFLHSFYFLKPNNSYLELFML